LYTSVTKGSWPRSTVMVFARRLMSPASPPFPEIPMSDEKLTGEWTQPAEQCPRCNARLLVNAPGDKWCSSILCAYGCVVTPSSPPAPTHTDLMISPEAIAAYDFPDTTPITPPPAPPAPEMNPMGCLTLEQVEALIAAGHQEGPYIHTYLTASATPPPVTREPAPDTCPKCASGSWILHGTVWACRDCGRDAPRSVATILNKDYGLPVLAAASPEGSETPLQRAMAVAAAEYDAMRATVVRLQEERDELRETARLGTTALGKLAARAIAAEQERDALKSAGAMLANCAYNLAQDDSLSERYRHSLDASRKAWDDAARSTEEPA
jgi:hypothetical protein